ncbi:hypothetical protein MMC30_007244 [Trapelia coarctata]|nr:hypothetical protein [Trapelia coarctata]
MKFYIISALFALLVVATASPAQFKEVMVTWSKAPDSVVLQAKNSIIAAGGTITHDFELIRGFVAQAPVKAITALSQFNSPNIEETSVVTALGRH